MPLPPSIAWKLVLVLVLVAGIMLSACARAPRRPLPRAELRRLVLAALILYAVGVYVSGIAACALAAWLSRGSDSEDPPGGGEDPPDEQPPPDPDGLPMFDWPAFERQFRSYASRRREPAGFGR
jgi:hypothetical protein